MLRKDEVISEQQQNSVFLTRNTLFLASRASHTGINLFDLTEKFEYDSNGD